MVKIDQTGAEDWQGERGDHWLRDMDKFESMLEPLGLALLERAALQPGDRVVDIGCGGGWTSRKAAMAVSPTGSVRGVDIAPMLVNEAKSRASGMANVDFICADAGEGTVPGAPFDRMISRLGVMFFSDPAMAFTRLRSLLRDGGHMDWAVWAPPEDNPWMSGARKIASKHIELARPDLSAPGPFALSDPARLTDLLTQAGFNSVDIAPWNGKQSVGGQGSSPEQAADFAMTAFSFSDAMLDIAPDARSAIRSDLIDFYAGYYSDGVLGAPAKAWLVQAKSGA